jgi:Asp-tRNA(Asn)/Glu-tRNA(Gln) amidotransferase A subunit family amidase
MRMTLSRLLIPAIIAAVAYLIGMFVGGLAPAIDTRGAERLAGLEFTAAERDSMTDDLSEYTRTYERLREVPLANSVAPALLFSPLPAGFAMPSGASSFRPSAVRAPKRPADVEDLAFASVAELSAMVHARTITSTELTKMFLERLRRYGPILQCVVTLTDSLAMAQAARADAELARGFDRGPLHGIPYGAKDLLAQKDYPTTWGSVAYKDQHLSETATVVRKLEEAGAVLVAKLTLGELAWGDVWFGGMTRNPWDTTQGSSGSSAGSASATAAGLVPFAIGSETWGSIVSPSDRCGTSGLRPTFGRVSRAGAMALSWSMDKIGPIARSAEDCAFVFKVIHGYDPLDPTTVRDVPFRYDASLPLRSVRLGFYRSAFDSVKRQKHLADSVLTVLRSLGADLIPVEFPADPSVNDLSHILSAEAAAAFDDLTRSNRDDLLVRQIKNAWPNVFRSARFIPAVEYIQANRVRSIVIEKMATMFRWVDVVVTPSFGGDQLLLTNLTGHPCVVVPMGFTDRGTPASISFIGQLYDEGRLLAVARAYQEATGHHRKHPVRFQKE